MPIRLMLLTVLSVGCLLACPSAEGADWPRFRGVDGQGHSDAKGLPTTWSTENNVLWKTSLPGPGGSSPILVGKRIFLTCYTGYAVPGEPRGDMEGLKRHLVCLDRSTGKVAWAREAPPVLPDSARNREDHGYSTSTPVADAERVYVFYGKTGVFAYSLGGRKLWQADVGSKTSGWGSAASPVLWGDMLIVNASVESESLVALDKRTGKEKWRAGGIKESWNTPILVPAGAGKTELVVAMQGKVLGLDPATGKGLWSCETDIPWYMVPSLVTDGRVAYCIGGRGTGGALAVRPGGRGDVTATHRLWTLRKGSNVSSPILADGKLYYISRPGRCYVVAAKPEFALLGTSDLGRVGTVNASPAAETGRLYIRSNEFLFCFGTGK